MNDLRKCPFCGMKESVKVATDTEIEQSDKPLTGYYAVVCCRTKGGCGAASGYAEKLEDAIEKWNRRNCDVDLIEVSNQSDENIKTLKAMRESAQATLLFGTTIKKISKKEYEYIEDCLEALMWALRELEKR
jgi:Lar family restriction alleviation protein